MKADIVIHVWRGLVEEVYTSRGLINLGIVIVDSSEKATDLPSVYVMDELPAKLKEILDDAK